MAPSRSLVAGALDFREPFLNAVKEPGGVIAASYAHECLRMACLPVHPLVEQVIPLLRDERAGKHLRKPRLASLQVEDQTMQLAVRAAPYSFLGPRRMRPGTGRTPERFRRERRQACHAGGP